MYWKLHALCAKPFLNWKRNSSQNFTGLSKSFSLPGFAHENHVRKTTASASKLSHCGIVPITQQTLTGTTADRIIPEHGGIQGGELSLPPCHRHPLTFVKFSCIAKLTLGHLWVVFFPALSPSWNEVLCFHRANTQSILNYFCRGKERTHLDQS